MRIIGFAGKGGTGKTTLAALFLKALVQQGKSVLVIDSDPNECLPAVLGAKDYVRISDVVKTYEGKTMNPVKFSQDFAAMLAQNEQDSFDLIVMGRGEGEGCYCLINHLLKSSFQQNILKGGYTFDYILMDCEAGLEHISRRTSTLIHDLVVVTDSSKMGLDTIGRVREVSREVKSEVQNFYVVANKVGSGKIAEQIKAEAEKHGMRFLGKIPYDASVEEFNFAAKSLLELPDNSTAFKEAQHMLNKILAVPVKVQAK